MIRLNCVGRAILVPMLWATFLNAADFSNYRGFQFGRGLDVAVKQAGATAGEARLVHQRPALIQELDWRPISSDKLDAAQIDPVRDSLLRFYNGELFQIVTTYDRDKVNGMTEGDMVGAISLIYGTPTKPAVEVPYHSNFGETATVIARWENSDYSNDLIRTGDRTSFALILNSKRLNELAQAAIVEAVRLDALEAPQREKEVQQKREAKERLILDKARSANMPNFHP